MKKNIAALFILLSLLVPLFSKAGDDSRNLDMARFSVPPGIDPIIDFANLHSMAQYTVDQIRNIINISDLRRMLTQQIPIPPGIDPISDIYNLTHLGDLHDSLMKLFGFGGEKKVKLPDTNCTVLNRDLYAGDGWVVKNGESVTDKGEYYNEILALQSFLAFTDKHYFDWTNDHINGFWGHDRYGGPDKKTSRLSAAILEFQKDNGLSPVRVQADGRTTLTTDWLTREKIRQMSCEDKKHPQKAKVSGPLTLKAGQEGAWFATAIAPEDYAKKVSYGVVWGDEEDISPLGLISSTTKHQVEFQNSGTFKHTYATEGTKHATFYFRGDNGKMSYRSLFIKVTADPMIKLTNPVGGEVWDKNIEKTIYWDFTGLGTNATVTVSLLSSTTRNVVSIIDSNVPNLGIYKKKFNAVPDDSYYLQVSWNKNPNIKDYTDRPITFGRGYGEDVNNDLLVRVTPTDGGIYRAGKKVNVEWVTDSGNYGYAYRIELWKESSNSAPTLVQFLGYGQNGKALMELPKNLVENQAYHVRIRSTYVNNVWNRSPIFYIGNSAPALETCSLGFDTDLYLGDGESAIKKQKVKDMQMFLVSKGAMSSLHGQTGFFDRVTFDAMKAWQKTIKPLVRENYWGSITRGKAEAIKCVN